MPIGVYIRTEYHRKINSESHRGQNKGKPSPMKGKHYPKMSEVKRGKPAWNKNKHIQTNTGKTHFKKGHVSPNRGKFGEEHPAYKNPEDRITPLHVAIRVLNMYEEWCGWVKEWDNYTCQKCGKVGGNLHSHHIKTFSEIIKENNITSTKEAETCNALWDVSNGITYCEECHRTLENKGGLL